jgi:hypothetical protein
LFDDFLLIFLCSVLLVPFSFIFDNDESGTRWDR